VFRLSLTAAAYVLVNGVPLTVVDGTNRFDLYYLTEFARRWGAPRGMGPSQILERIFLSRAFTCYQMEAVVTERLPAFLQKMGSPVVLIFGLLDTFYDEQAPLFEVQASLGRVMATLQALKRAHVSVLLASRDARPAAPDRRALFPRLAASMDRVYSVNAAAPAVSQSRRVTGGAGVKRVSLR
jgi:hypothetical protein